MKNIIIGTALRNGLNNEILIAAFNRTGVFEFERFAANYIIKVKNVDLYKDILNCVVKLEFCDNMNFCLKKI